MSGDAEINSRLTVGEARDRADVSGVRVDRARDVYVTTAEGRPPLWVNVPGLRAHFVGREALVQELAERLTAGENVSPAAHGLPGAGKSTLASRVAHRRDVLDHFEDGVLWAGLGPQGDVARLLGQWALALEEDVSGLLEIEERRRAVRRLIGQRRLLIVIDDAWDEEAAHLLRCGGPRCAYLLTTRDRGVARAFAGRENALFVPPLDQDPAETLLRELAPEAYAADAAAVGELARRTGRLPLALELVGGYLGADEQSLWPDLTQAALAEMADPERRLQLAARRLGAAGEGEVTLQETIALSVDNLPEEARRAFVALGAFAPRPETFSRAAAEAVAETDGKTLAGLVRRNLLEQAEDGDLAMHQTLADSVTGETPEAAVARHRDYYLALVDEDREDWRRIEGVYGQIVRAWERAPEDESVLDFVWALRVFQIRRGLWQDQMAWIRQGLGMARAVGLRRDEGTLLNNLGWVCDSVGERNRSLEYYERALAIREEVGDRQGVGTTLNNIGAVYRNVGRYEEALNYYERALDVEEELGDRPMLGTTLNNVGAVYRNLHRYEEALDHYERALAISQEVGDRPGMGRTLSNIGGVYRKLGRNEEALAYIERALAIREEVGDRAGVGKTLNNIGLLYGDLGRNDEALDYFGRALAILEEVGDRAGVGTTLNYIGLLYDKLGRREQALDYYKQALAIREEVGDRPGMGTMLNNIGLVYGNRGQYKKALAYYEQALAILEEVGDRHVESVTRYNMASLYRKDDRVEEAVAQLRQAAELAAAMQNPHQDRFAAELAELEAELAERGAAE